VTTAKPSARRALSAFWVTRDRYENPLSYSIWSVEPIHDRDGHWARHDPKRLGTDVRQICSARVAEAVIGRTLKLGEKLGPIVGVCPALDFKRGSEPPAQTAPTTPSPSSLRHKADRGGPGTGDAHS
jgi:hypothetical protein